MTPRWELVTVNMTCNHKNTGFRKFRLLILRKRVFVEDADPPEGAGHSQEGLKSPKRYIFERSKGLNSLEGSFFEIEKAPVGTRKQSLTLKSPKRDRGVIF